jgi:hypothetical protein
LLKEAKALCDEGGFKRFKEKFCPSLGRSRSYELFAVSVGRKTDEQTKSETRERQRKHRTKIKAKLAETEPLRVGDKPEGEIDVERPLVTDEPERNAVNATDIALREFNEKILRLVQMTRTNKPERFAKTSVSVTNLSQLGRFLEKVAAASEALNPARADQLVDVGQEGPANPPPHHFDADSAGPVASGSACLSLGCLESRMSQRNGEISSNDSAQEKAKHATAASLPEDPHVPSSAHHPADNGGSR